jgi:rhomboid protease GluP
MVLHAGVIHFALNAYALWMFGPMLERYLGRLRYLAVYLIAGFTGAAASFAINDTVLGVGASGAIFGLLGGLIAFFWRRRDRGGMAQLRGLIIVVVLNLALSASIPNIDNVAHVGGFLGGLVAVWLLDSAPKRGQAVAVRQALALAVPVAAGIALVMVGIATFGGSPYASCAGV